MPDTLSLVHALLRPGQFEVRKFAAGGASLRHDAGIIASVRPARKNGPPLGLAADIPYNGRGLESAHPVCRVHVLPSRFRLRRRRFRPAAQAVLLFFVRELFL